MPESDRRWRRALFAGLTVACLSIAPGAALASVPPDTETVDTTPDPTTPDPTTPATTAPETDPTVVGGNPEDTDATTLTWIAIGATMALLGVAVWWMARRADGDNGPRMDDDWPGESTVI